MMHLDPKAWEALASLVLSVGAAFAARVIGEVLRRRADARAAQASSHSDGLMAGAMTLVNELQEELLRARLENVRLTTLLTQLQEELALARAEIERLTALAAALRSRMEQMGAADEW